MVSRLYHYVYVSHGVKVEIEKKLLYLRFLKVRIDTIVICPSFLYYELIVNNSRRG